jgi:hypothetical protein
MKVSELRSATRRALNLFDKWNDATGCFVKNSGYYDEILGVIEDAVHCGAQAATGDYKKLDSEVTPWQRNL